MDRFKIRENDQHSARYILKDIIEKDYKQLNTEQLTQLIEQNKELIEDLLKEYFMSTQKEEQKRREMKMMAEQCMRRLSVRGNRRQPSRSNVNDDTDPSRHVDMILQEYLCIKKINSQFDSASTVKEAAKPLESKKMMNI